MAAPPRNEFEEFLLAPIGADATGMPLTLLSALARLDVDPWNEAASLRQLSRESATTKLVSILESVPNGPAPGADTLATATRLLALLHRSPTQKAATPTAPMREEVATQSKGVNTAIYYLVALIVMLIGQWAMAVKQPSAPPDTNLPAPRN